MEVNKSTEYVFTKEEIEQILISHIRKEVKEDKGSYFTSWRIREGDTGIKDPMDYSPYQPTEVTSLVITG